MSELQTLVGLVEAELAETDAAYGDRPNWRDQHEYADWERRTTDARDALKEALLKAGAKINGSNVSDIEIRLGGVRSSSTSGLLNAVRNWLKAARKRFDKAA